MREVDATESIPVYKLNDLLGNELPGIYYRAELVPTPKPKDSDFYKVAKILKKKKVNGRTLYLTRFQNFSSKHDQWLDAKNFNMKKK